MQNSYRFSKVNNVVVNPVVRDWKLGFIADGKMLHCEDRNSLS